VSGDVKIRPVDLCANSGYRRAGIVLVGDAFETTCPVSGTGTDKVFTDIERLCNVHIPAWLATYGMDEIIVISGGRAIERGSHAELLAKHGAYRRLWDDQGVTTHPAAQAEDDSDDDDDEE